MAPEMLWGEAAVGIPQAAAPVLGKADGVNKTLFSPLHPNWELFMLLSPSPCPAGITGFQPCSKQGMQLMYPALPARKNNKSPLFSHPMLSYPGQLLLFEFFPSPPC